MKAKLSAPRSFPLDGFISAILVVLYVAIIVLCFTTKVGPRIFWTMALPLLVVSIVLMGYNAWRRICPLAFWGTLGGSFRPKKAKLRRIPEWNRRKQKTSGADFRYLLANRPDLSAQVMRIISMRLRQVIDAL